ncbi:MAG TPA: hypothetical protein VJH97_03145 [Candidatus Nanoarchaeia archaeon]|nr:hypothetical protein [Candidatus Nanoarchaeia archaeon]
MKLQCSRCSYAFESTTLPLRCPYCGKSGTVYKQKSAQDLLNEVET